MKIVNTFHGLTGRQLLVLETDEYSRALIAGELTDIIPMTLPFANQAEIADKEDATHVSVRTRVSGRWLVRVQK